MALDPRKHLVPLGSDAPRRGAFDDLSRSIRDAIPVATTTERASVLSTLAGLSPAITPSASNPIFFWRADAEAGFRLEVTTDGTTFEPALAATKSRVVRRVMANANTFTDRLTNTDFPNATDAAAMQITFKKISAATRLVLAIDATCNLTGGATQILLLSLSVGGTDYEVARRAFPTATNRQQFSGFTEITGLAAGDYIIKPRFRSSAGAIATFEASNDYLCYQVSEVM